jgi:hypothetical protein
MAIKKVNFSVNEFYLTIKALLKCFFFYHSCHQKSKLNKSYLVRSNFGIFDRFKGILRLKMSLLRFLWFLLCFQMKNNWKMSFRGPKTRNYMFQQPKLLIDKMHHLFSFFKKNNNTINNMSSILLNKKNKKEI